MPKFEPIPATREQALKRSIDVVRYGHDVLYDEHQKVMDAVLGIFEFQSIPSNLDSKRVYQYELHNQKMYQEHEMIIISATATFLPVVNNYKNELWKSELQVGSEYDTEYKDSTPQPQTDEKKSFKEMLGFGGKKKRIIDSNAPYQHGIPYLTDSLAKIERLERFGEMQSYGVDLAEHTSFAGMMQYLQFHRTRFKFEIAPEIIRKHKQYIDLILTQERIGAIQIAGKLDNELYSSRNDEKF